MVLSSRWGVCSLSCWHPHRLSHRLWLQKLALGGCLFFSLAYCTGFGWDGVFLCSSSYGAVQICDPNGGGVAAVVWLLLSSAYAVSLHARAPWLFVTLPLPLSRLVGAQLGTLSWTDQSCYTPCDIMLSQKKKNACGGRLQGRYFVETGWASACYREVVSDYLCITCLFFCYFISLINFILTHNFFLAFGLPILPHHIMGSEQAATWRLVCKTESVYHVYMCVCVCAQKTGWSPEFQKLGLTIPLDFWVFH